MEQKVNNGYFTTSEWNRIEVSQCMAGARN